MSAAATWEHTAAGAAIAAAALLAVSVGRSIALLVPINNRSVTWTADDHPDDWREQHQRWDRLHYARVAILITPPVQENDFVYSERLRASPNPLRKSRGAAGARGAALDLAPRGKTEPRHGGQDTQAGRVGASLIASP
jgi:hypothetical protein